MQWSVIKKSQHTKHCACRSTLLVEDQMPAGDVFPPVPADQESLPMIGYCHELSSVCLSIRPSVCDDVYCGAQGRCRGLKVVPSCS